MPLRRERRIWRREGDFHVIIYPFILFEKKFNHMHMVKKNILQNKDALSNYKKAKPLAF